MVIATKNPSNHHSSTDIPSSGDSDNANLPRKSLPSPWAQVVRGGEPESTIKIHQSPPSSSSSSSSLAAAAGAADPAPPSDSSANAVPASPPMDSSNRAAVVDSSDDASDGNAGRSKKPAWNKPSNGAVETAAGTGPVMGAESWPALSASTKASGKSPAESSSKTVADGSLSTSQGPVTLHAPAPQKHASQARPNSATNYNTSNRQRSMKRVGGSSIGPIPAQSDAFPSPPVPPPPPPFPLFPAGYGNMVPVISDPSARDHYRNSNWDTRPLVGGFVPVMNEPRGSSLRGNFGSHPQGDGSYHNNYGSRRDQDRGNYVNTRDAHIPQPRAPPRGLLRHPHPNPHPNTVPFLGQPVGSFANPMVEFYYYPTVTMEHYRGVPFYNQSSPPATFYASAAEPPPISIPNRIVKQIDYYFSDANLRKDEYLKSNMDEHGWVPISLIANFPRVKCLTSDIQLILNSMRTSTVVEVQGDKLRRQYEWMRFLPSAQSRVDSGSISPGGSRSNNLATDFQAVSLNETTKGKAASTQSQLLNSGGDAGGNN